MIQLAPPGLLPDWVIERDIKIEPLAPQQSRKGVISYGLTSYGYDVRVGYKFKVLTEAMGENVMDPKLLGTNSFMPILLSEEGRHQFDNEYRCEICGYESIDEDLYIANAPHRCNNFIIIPPNSFALAETVEYLEIPRDVLAVCLGKSTYARCGIIVNVTPLEPEWRGRITIEISNTTPLPAKIYAGEGIAQILFFRAAEQCRTSYADKKGKYQDQAGLTLPIVD